MPEVQESVSKTSSDVATSEEFAVRDLVGTFPRFCLPDALLEISKSGGICKPISKEFMSYAGCVLEGQRNKFTGQVSGPCKIPRFEADVDNRIKKFLALGVHVTPCVYHATCGSWFFFCGHHFYFLSTAEGFLRYYGWHREMENGSCKYCVCPQCSTSRNTTTTSLQEIHRMSSKC